MINQLHKDRNWQTVVLLILGFGSSLAITKLIHCNTFLWEQAYAIWTGIGVVGGSNIRNDILW